MGRKAVARKYLQGWFTLDLVSSFPIDLVLFGKRSDLWRLPRLLKVMLTSIRVSSLLHAYPTCVIHTLSTNTQCSNKSENTD